MLDQPHTQRHQLRTTPPTLHAGNDEWSAPDTRIVPPRRPLDSAPGMDSTALVRVAALSNLLVTRESGRATLVEALRLGIEMLSEAARLSLAIVGERSPDDLTEVASASRIAPGDGVRAEPRMRRVRTLGLGEDLDRRVLLGGEAVRADGLRCQPLRSARGPILGALVVHCAVDLSARSKDALCILSDLLVVLLERQQSERTREVVLGALAAPHPARQAATEPRPDVVDHYEGRALRSLVGALRALPGVCGGIALVPVGGGRLCTLAPRRAARELDRRASQRVRAVAAAARRGQVVEITAGTADWEAAAPLLQLLARTGQPRPERLLLLPADGASARIAIVVLALHWQDAPPWLHAAQSLCLVAGERIAAGRARAALEAQGNAYDAFLSLMAHELRSPLTSVKGYAQLLIRQARRNALPDSAMRSVQAIEQQAVRLAEMIDELHDAARIRRNRLDLLTGTMDLARHRATAGRALAPSLGGS